MSSELAHEDIRRTDEDACGEVVDSQEQPAEAAAKKMNEEKPPSEEGKKSGRGGGGGPNAFRFGFVERLYDRE
jgi:hypothetical protein